MPYRSSAQQNLLVGIPAKIGLLAAVVLLLSLANPVAASSRTAVTAALCDRATSKAAREHGVPLDVLQAISRAETGRLQQGALQPWPWTVNMEGKGRWFENADAARAYVFRHFKAGARSFDVGCFQINYLWHGDAFRSIDDMFDPLLNARYAAKFLKDLYREFGDWSAAAGAYHSRTPTYARSYTARFSKIRNALAPNAPQRDQNDPPSSMLISDAVNQPFIGRGSVAMGSLVPIGLNPQADAPVRPAFLALN